MGDYWRQQPHVWQAGVPVEEIQARQAVERAPILADLDSGRLTVRTVLLDRRGRTVREVRLDGEIIGRLRRYQAGRTTYLQVIALWEGRWRECSSGMPHDDELEALVRLYGWRADAAWRGRSLGVTL